MSEYAEAYEEEQQIDLVSQVLTDPYTLGKGKVNKTRVAHYTNSDEIPDTVPAVLYLKIRHELTGAKWAKIMADTYDDITLGINGRGQKFAIKAEQVRKGGMVSDEPSMEKPSWLERYVTNRRKAWEYDHEREELGLEPTR